MDLIQDILLIFLIIFQFAVLTYLVYINYQKYKQDKKFWEKQEEISNEFLKQLQEQPAVFLCEDNAKLEEDVVIDQKNTSKKRDDKDGDRRRNKTRDKSCCRCNSK